MTTNFEKFVEFNGVLQEWKVLRDEKDAEQVKSISITTKTVTITTRLLWWMVKPTATTEPRRL